MRSALKVAVRSTPVVTGVTLTLTPAHAEALRTLLRRQAGAPILDEILTALYASGAVQKPIGRPRGSGFVNFITPSFPEGL